MEESKCKDVVVSINYGKVSTMGDGRIVSKGNVGKCLWD